MKSQKRVIYNDRVIIHDRVSVGSIIYFTSEQPCISENGRLLYKPRAPGGLRLRAFRFLF